MTGGGRRPRARRRVLAMWVAAAALAAPRGPGPPLAAADPAPRSEPDDPVAPAAAAFAALRFDEALRLADQTWRSGHNGPDQLRRIFALAGRAAGSIGEDRAARLWFSRWLYLEPDAALPDGTSPKLTALFGDARATLAGTALIGHAIVQPDGVRVTVADDPLDLVAAARAGATRVALRDGAAVVPVTAAVREVELVDRYGNRLTAIDIKPAPAAAPVPAPASAEPTPALPGGTSRAWYAHPVTWAVATGVLAAAGGAGLWIAVDARSDLRDLDDHSATHQFSEAKALQQRFDRAQIAAGIAFGAAAVTAVVGGTLWLRDRGEPIVGVSPGAASIAWRMQF